MTSSFFFQAERRFYYLYKEIESCYKNMVIFKGEGYTGNEYVEVKESKVCIT